MGAAAGAIGLTLLPQISRGPELWAPAVYAVLVILTMAIAPDGLFPKNRLATLWRRATPVRVKVPRPERTHA
jgi:uncharacterized membrane protein YoaK (UPF0700 family)